MGKKTFILAAILFLALAALAADERTGNALPLPAGKQDGKPAGRPVR